MASKINTAVNTTTAYSATSAQLSDEIKAVYSKEIMFSALPIMPFYQFATVKNELAEQAGMTISMLTYADLSRGAALTEGTEMETDALSSSMKSITVAEHGKAVAVTELALQATFTDTMAGIVKALSRNVALTIDCDLRDVAMAGGAGTSTIFGRATSATPKVSAIGDVTAAHVFSIASTNDAVELLQTNNVPKIQGSYYVAIVHPHQIRSLRDDSAWINVANYAQPDTMLTNEVGRINDVRFIETSSQLNGEVATTDIAYSAALDGTGSGAINLYKAVVMGEDYYGLAVGLPVEMRDDPAKDLGRMHKVGWYSIYGSAVINPKHAVLVITA